MGLMSVYTGIRPRFPLPPESNRNKAEDELQTIVKQHSGTVDHPFLPVNSQTSVWETIRSHSSTTPGIPNRFQGCTIMYGQSGSGKTYSTLELLSSFVSDAARGTIIEGHRDIDYSLEAIELLGSQSWDLVAARRKIAVPDRCAALFLESKVQYDRVDSAEHLRELFRALPRDVASTRKNATSSRRHTVYRLVSVLQTHR